ncbi:MAG: hypothetical protein H7320_16880 [Ferruginibacter sp.]|nr:hypothetical protein [Ferruginibacter sp.]
MKTLFCTFTIWVLAALINATLSASCLLLKPGEFDNWAQSFGLSFFFTLLFSLPSVFIFWLLFLMNNKEDGQSLFQLLYRTGFVTAVFSAIFFAVSFYSMFKSYVFLLGFCIIVAAVTSIMCHHSLIAIIHKQKLHSHA